MKNMLPDTPWHIGYAKKKEDDPRRHKSRCSHIENGYCRVIGAKCGGSAHCTFYEEKSEKSYETLSYGLKSANERFFPKTTCDFVHDYTIKEKQHYVKDINNCLLCGQEIGWYKSLSYMAKKCNFCKILYANEDVYHTYTADINRSLGDNLLCLVGISAPKERKETSVITKEKSQSKAQKKNKSLKLKQEEPTCTLGSDPRFKDIFSKKFS